MSPRRIVTVDCDYLFPKFAASYLLIDGDRAAFIDTGTRHSVPLLLAALEREGLGRDAVDAVIITHIHLDHAGGSSLLMTECPRARLLAHPRAARHAIDPTKLVASARKVYGDAEFERLYGAITPIDAARVQALDDGAKVAFGHGSPLEFIHTRGHAKHHFCVFEADNRVIFTGDSFGLAYPALQRSGLFIFPSTSPTDFEAPEAQLSIDRILATGSRAAYLTHFGPVTDLAGAARQLRQHLAFSAELVARKSVMTVAELQKELARNLEAAAAAAGLRLTPDDWEFLRLDLELNAQGLAHVRASH